MASTIESRAKEQMSSSSDDIKTKKTIPPPDVLKIQEKIHDSLYSQKTNQLIVTVEGKTHLSRDHLAAVGVLLFAFYLIFGNYASTLCNLIGFVYPAYATIKNIRTKAKVDDTKWLIYWTVFGFFCVIDTFAESIMEVFPLYYLSKTAFFLYLYLPQTNGTEYIYVNYVDPTINVFEEWMGERALSAVPKYESD